MAVAWTRQERLRMNLIAAVLCVDAVLLAFGRMTLEVSSLSQPVAATAGLVALGLWYRRRNEPVLANILIGTGHLVAFTAAGAILNYLAFTFDRPLIDAQLYRIDQMLGIDWVPFYTTMKAVPVLGTVLSIAYMSSLVQIALVIPLLGLTRRHDELDRFLLAFMVAALCTIAFWAAFPAFGAGTYLYSIGVVKEFPGSVVGLDVVKLLLALKSGEITHFSLANAEGLIAFPSFHTAMALLSVSAVVTLRWLFWPVLAWNMLVLLSVPIDGTHHVVDVAGGAAVAWLGIAVARRSSRVPIEVPAVAAPASAVTAHAGDPIWIRFRESPSSGRDVSGGVTADVA